MKKVFKIKKITMGSYSWLEVKNGRKKIGTISQKKDGFFVSTSTGTATERQTKEGALEWLVMLSQPILGSNFQVEFQEIN
jgi:hypothetical protein